MRKGLRKGEAGGWLLPRLDFFFARKCREASRRALLIPYQQNTFSQLNARLRQLTGPRLISPTSSRAPLNKLHTRGAVPRGEQDLRGSKHTGALLHYPRPPFFPRLRGNELFSFPGYSASFRQARREDAAAELSNLTAHAYADFVIPAEEITFVWLNSLVLFDTLYNESVVVYCL